MTVLAIGRDWAPSSTVSIVRLVTDDSLQDILQPGWLDTQALSIEKVNDGPFEWARNDVVLINLVDPLNNDASIQSAFFYVFAGFHSVNPISPIMPNLQNIVAHAGGGQANATQLNIGINYVTTVATAGDSVLMPPNVLGQTVLVVNASTTNQLNIFPSNGDFMAFNAVNTSFGVQALKSIMFVGATTNRWCTVFPTP